MFDDEHLKEKLKSVCETKNILLEHLYHKPQLNPDEIYAELMEYKKMVEEDPNLQIIVDQVQYSTYKTPFIPQYQEAKEIFANESRSASWKTTTPQSRQFPAWKSV